MKLASFFFFLFQIMQLAAQPQPINEEHTHDSIRIKFLKLIVEGVSSADNFVAVPFEGKNGYKEIAMIPEKALENYFLNVQKISNESINKALFTFLFELKTLPLSDSTRVYEYYGVCKLNQDSLAVIEKIPLNVFIKQYFDWGGGLKPEYRNSEFLLAYYLYNKNVKLYGWGSTYPSIDYVGTNRLLGNGWPERY